MRPKASQTRSRELPAAAGELISASCQPAAAGAGLGGQLAAPPPSCSWPAGAGELQLTARLNSSAGHMSWLLRSWLPSSAAPAALGPIWDFEGRLFLRTPRCAHSIGLHCGPSLYLPRPWPRRAPRESSRLTLLALVPHITAPAAPRHTGLTTGRHAFCALSSRVAPVTALGARRPLGATP